MKKKNKVIYIGGYGHSGSTILECLLSVDNQTIGLGELFRLDDEWNAQYTHYLLNQNSECAQIYKSLQIALEVIGESIESISEVNNYENIFPKKNYKVRYNKLWSVFFGTVNNNGNKTIVDSSKTSYKSFLRLRRLHQIDNLNVRLIHLIRRPSYILQKASDRHTEGSKYKKLKSFLIVGKTAISWTISNFIFIYNPNRPYIIVPYEVLCESPEDTLNSISRVHGLSLQETIKKIRNKSVIPRTCAISGNMKVRKNDNLYFDPKISSRPKIDFLVRVFSFFLNYLYNYLVRQSVVK